MGRGDLRLPSAIQHLGPAHPRRGGYQHPVKRAGTGQRAGNVRYAPAAADEPHPRSPGADKAEPGPIGPPTRWRSPQGSFGAVGRGATNWLGGIGCASARSLGRLATSDRCTPINRAAARRGGESTTAATAVVVNGQIARIDPRGGGSIGGSGGRNRTIPRTPWQFPPPAVGRRSDWTWRRPRGRGLVARDVEDAGAAARSSSGFPCSTGASTSPGRQFVLQHPRDCGSGSTRRLAPRRWNVPVDVGEHRGLDGHRWAGSFAIGARQRVNAQGPLEAADAGSAQAGGPMFLS